MGVRVKNLCVFSALFTQSERKFCSVLLGTDRKENENNRETYVFDKKLGQSFRLGHTFLQLTQEITEERSDIHLTISHQEDHMKSACTKFQTTPPTPNKGQFRNILKSQIHDKHNQR